MKNNQYWLVGASSNGGELHHDKKWVEQGIWKLLWHYRVNHNGQDQIALSKKIKVGDRIAIKRMLGGNRVGIKVLHLGIVMRGTGVEWLI